MQIDNNLERPLNNKSHIFNKLWFFWQQKSDNESILSTYSDFIHRHNLSLK